MKATVSDGGILEKLAFMNTLELMSGMGHEQVTFCRDDAAGYRGIIAIHSTRLGPAVGGTRLRRYGQEEDALVDALRLSRGMTYKNAVAGLPMGGGKAVILAPSRVQDREALFRAHGRFIDRFGGRFLTGEDVGTSPADMEYIAKETKYVGGRLAHGGDPSPFTALGVLCGIQAAAQWRWGSCDLKGKRVALQGCGHVGYLVAKNLNEAGAKLLVADIDGERAARAAADFEAIRVEPEVIYDAAADIFSPCALGGVLNDRTIPRLRVEIVAGAANNQLLEDRHGDALEARGMLYAPDYVINAGGVISGASMFGWSADRIDARVRSIHERLLEVFEIARAAGIPAHVAADRYAERRLETAN